MKREEKGWEEQRREGVKKDGGGGRKIGRSTESTQLSIFLHL
jgi:hypothetical protein